MQRGYTKANGSRYPLGLASRRPKVYPCIFKSGYQILIQSEKVVDRRILKTINSQILQMPQLQMQTYNRHKYYLFFMKFVVLKV